MKKAPIWSGWAEPYSVKGVKMLNKKIAVIGAGKMGGALIEGILKAGLVSPRDIMAADRDKTKLRPLARKRVRITTDNLEAVKWGEVIILSVKPQHIDEVLSGINIPSSKFKLFISIAAGLKTGILEKRLGKVRSIRVMPNTPALIGEGMSVISLGRQVRPRDKKIALAIFGSVGQVMVLPEKKMDAVTALSGSGPAYFFFLMEALLSGGRRLGLSDNISLKLVLQVARGAALLARKSGIPPTKLREMVTSPGGTTEAAFKVLEKAGVKEAIIKALVAAEQRSRELSLSQ